MRTCVKGEKENASETINNASEECKAERTADPEAFAATYGTGKNGKNALGKCVSSKVEDDDHGRRRGVRRTPPRSARPRRSR